jgi:hypothetical protein
MKILEFIFHFGVMIAIFTFLWWFVGLLLSMVFAPFGVKPARIYYAQKILKYFFLVTVAYRFADDSRFGLESTDYKAYVISSLVLLAYLIGKTEAKNNRVKFYAQLGNLQNGVHITPFDRTKELLLIGFAILVYAYFVFSKDGSHNILTNWLVDSIVSISDIPIFGWIFRLIGFFFLVMVILRFVNGFFALFGLTRPIQENDENEHFLDNNNVDNFDDYEEIE